jgi:hypothetical protein
LLLFESVHATVVRFLSEGKALWLTCVSVSTALTVFLMVITEIFTSRVYVNIKDKDVIVVIKIRIGKEYAL